MHPRRAFTLIELLVVIAIIAILAVVVVLVLNPAQLLAQSRDANRVSDMATLNSALNLYSTDQSGASGYTMGSSSVVYASLPDASSTSCTDLGLPAMPTGYAWGCTTPQALRNASSSGWVPVDLKAISSGSPLGSLPIDPVNSSSSRLFYTYTTNGTQYEVTASMESQKYRLGGSGDVIAGDGSSLATVYAKGTNLALEPLDYGDPSLVGYWPLDEGANAVAYDDSGNNATGSWQGTQAGTSGYYSPGLNQAWAGTFDGTTTYINLPASPFGAYPASGNTNNYSLTFTTWFKTASSGSILGQSSNTLPPTSPGGFVPAIYVDTSGKVRASMFWHGSTGSQIVSVNSYADNNWHSLADSYNNGVETLYIDGVLIGSQSMTEDSYNNIYQYFLGTAYSGLWPLDNGGWFYFIGLINDVRIYDRALSPAEIAALYGAKK